MIDRRTPYERTHRLPVRFRPDTCSLPKLNNCPTRRNGVSQCNECGNHVTADFHRVFADNEGVLYGCPECMSMTDIKNGKVAGL